MLCKIIMDVGVMAKKPLSHYVPKFSNKQWADQSSFMAYYICNYSDNIKKKEQGFKQWGRLRGLYSWDVENALDRDLETKVAPIYEKILSFKSLDWSERIIWSQFLLSQLVRTPTFIKYEQFALKVTGNIDKPLHDRVGCPDCIDLNYVINRNWLYMIAHEDDYFVRTDNPVLQTGFIEDKDTCLYYPLSPKVCFVACSMTDGWNPFQKNDSDMIGYELDKGIAHMINFHFAKSAEHSLIISPSHDGIIAETMFNDVLGIYPQPPFSLHSPTISEFPEAYCSIRNIMSMADNLKYPDWNVDIISPLYFNE